MIRLSNLRKQSTVILYGNEITDLYNEFIKLKNSKTNPNRLEEIRNIFQEYLFGTDEARLVLA